MWIVEYWEDVRSDFAVFFRLDDPTELDGPTFFARAFRLAHYRGAIRDIAMAEAHEEEQRNAPSSSSSQRGYPQPKERITESQLAAQLGGAPGWLEKD